MRKTTKGHGWLGSVLAAAVVVAVMLLTLGGSLSVFVDGGNEAWFAAAMIALYVLAGVAVIIGVLAALIQRRREIRGGEEDEARKY